MTLYHYTCKHMAAKITRYGTLRPHRQPVFGCPDILIWLTDLAEPDREGLGLTSHILTCDRTEVRYLVAARCARPWLTSPERARSSQHRVALMEMDRRPEHWFIASEAVPAIRDRHWDQRTVTV